MRSCNAASRLGPRRYWGYSRGSFEGYTYRLGTEWAQAAGVSKVGLHTASNAYRIAAHPYRFRSFHCTEDFHEHVAPVGFPGCRCRARRVRQDRASCCPGSRLRRCVRRRCGNAGRLGRSRRRRYGGFGCRWRCRCCDRRCRQGRAGRGIRRQEVVVRPDPSTKRKAARGRLFRV